MKTMCTLLLSLAVWSVPLSATPLTLGWSFPVEDLTKAVAQAGQSVGALVGTDEADIQAMATPGDCPTSLAACWRDCRSCMHDDEGCNLFTLQSCLDDCTWLFTSGTCPCD